MTGLHRAYSQARVDLLKTTRGYDILDEIAIVDYDRDWDSLADRLWRTKKTQYLPQQKYVIHHHDTEYFLNDLGFATENFNRVIRSLDLDPCRFVIFTNHRHSTAAWLRYCDHDRNQFEVIETPWTQRLCHPQDLQLMPVTRCRYHFCAIMGAGRSHRDKLVHWIRAKNLEQHNLVIYHKDGPRTQPTLPKSQEPTGRPTTVTHYLTTVPFTRVNEDWSNGSRFDSSCDALQDARIPAYDASTTFQCPWYQEVLLDLVAETVFHYPYAYISEKTVRPIVNGRPFVIVGAAHTLAWLKEMGFKTFDPWWDEHYDSETDPDQRLGHVFDTLDMICSWSSDRCREVLQEMQPILQHNQRVYRELAF